MSPRTNTTVSKTTSGIVLAHRRDRRIDRRVDLLVAVLRRFCLDRSEERLELLQPGRSPGSLGTDRADAQLMVFERELKQALFCDPQPPTELGRDGNLPSAEGADQTGQSLTFRHSVDSHAARWIFHYSAHTSYAIPFRWESRSGLFLASTYAGAVVELGGEHHLPAAADGDAVRGGGAVRAGARGRG